MGSYQLTFLVKGCLLHHTLQSLGISVVKVRKTDKVEIPSLTTAFIDTVECSLEVTTDLDPWEILYEMAKPFKGLVITPLLLETTRILL